ncbi:hypothetical protein CB1_000994005 [Camelus ferus]|nr:hypothetical protein CB1_000994005 [Camelus ferus]
MKVYQKSTFSSRMKSRSHLGQIATYTDTAGSSIDKFGLDPTLILSQAESISSEDSLEFFLDDDMDYDLEPELYFKEPEELLQVLTELEEQNLTLVQYSQDVDENLEDVNKRERLIQDKMCSGLGLPSGGSSKDGTDTSLSSEKLIDSLSKKINQVYKVCIGDAEVGSLNPVQKLVKVESRLVELSDLIESIPKENVEAIERMKQKERRQKYSHYLMISV